MTLTRVPVQWPTDADRDEIGKQLQEAHDLVERTVWDLRQAAPSDTPAEWPDPAPTLETVGGIYDLLDTVRSHADSLSRFADDLARTIDNVNLVRLNLPLAAAAVNGREAS